MLHHHHAQHDDAPRHDAQHKDALPDEAGSPSTAPATEAMATSAAEALASRFAVTPKPSSAATADAHRLTQGQVVSAQERGALRVQTAEGATIAAKQAASCLLAPVVGDQVLVSHRTDGKAYVLAVLERSDDATSTTAELGVAGHRGDTRLRASGGALHLEAATGINLVAKRALRLSAARAEVVAGALTATAKRAMASFEETGLAGKSIDTAVERLTTRAARAFRFITETDQTRAKHIDAHASDTARVSSDSVAAVTAREVVSVDGSQVLIG